MFTIVVARYKEDIEWTKQFMNRFTKVIIYNKGIKLIEEDYNEILMENVGREGHTYYSHIVNNYDNLDDYTIFLQGNPFDHSPNLIDNLFKYINNKELNIYFDYLSEKIVNSCLGVEHGSPECKNLYTTFEKIFGVKPDNNNHECVFGAGAQFIVSKKSILKRTKDFYENIVNILNKEICPWEGYDVERLHKYIFTDISTV
jgi:hypothetical protein